MYLCICVYLRLSVISAGIICVSSMPIRDFDREPSLRLTRHHRNIISPSSHFLPHHQNIITYHTTFLFPLFTQPTTPTLPMLKFVHLPHPPLARRQLALAIVPHTVAESYLTVITFKPSHRLLRVLHPSLSHSHTFRARPTRNNLCLTHIHSFARRIGIICTSQRRNSCPICIKHVSCVSQHVC